MNGLNENTVAGPATDASNNTSATAVITSPSVDTILPVEAPTPAPEIVTSPVSVETPAPKAKAKAKKTKKVKSKAKSKIAKAKKAKAPSTGVRGRPVTMVTLKLTVLSNGKPVGKGRPALEGKSQRTYVYVPRGETYDVTKHGIGKKYNAALKASGKGLPSTKRVQIKSFAKWQSDEFRAAPTNETPTADPAVEAPVETPSTETAAVTV